MALDNVRESRSPERAVILLMLVGGPSQLETWDPKPDAPAEIRGPFSSIATRVPGIRISEHLPKMAVRLDQVALVRTVHHESAPIHETGQQLLQTGRVCRGGAEAPHFGAVVDRVAGNRWPDNRGFAVIPGPIKSTGVDIPHGQSNGWLADDDATLFAAAADTELVSRLERPEARARYGETPFGDSCLLARRLVESGTRVVTVNMFDTVFNKVTWDCHGSAPFSTLADYSAMLLPSFDHAFSALIDDLERVGRLETTLVMAAGEFGRTPRINAAGGRDHWPSVWSIAIAGGGVRGGRVVGRTDSIASSPADRPVTPQDLLATIYHSLGIDPAGYITRPDGQSTQLVENGSPIQELFA
jgi:uncharacterized protein (DUF1501 family)